MLEYVHFVPGRLRLKISELRHQHSAADAEAYVVAIPSVRSATANPITGSLTITYDEQRLAIGDLWELLRGRGYVSGRCLQSTVIDRRSPIGSAADRFGRAVMGALLDAVVQHSARALVRVLL
jgi:hypothetical protein